MLMLLCADCSKQVFSWWQDISHLQPSLLPARVHIKQKLGIRTAPVNYKPDTLIWNAGIFTSGPSACLSPSSSFFYFLYVCCSNSFSCFSSWVWSLCLLFCEIPSCMAWVTIYMQCMSLSLPASAFWSGEPHIQLSATNLHWVSHRYLKSKAFQLLVSAPSGFCCVPFQ